jgi:hypothetical protein
MTYTEIFEMVKAVGTPTATLVIGLYFISESRKQTSKVVEELWKTVSGKMDDQKRCSDDVKKEVTLIHKKTDLLLDQASNELDADNVINMAVNYLQKCHFVWMAYYRVRKEQNHVLDQTDVVAARWEEKITEFKKKLPGQFGRYTHKGVPLDNFWGPSGAEQYCRYLLNDLFGLQYSIAAGMETLIQEDDLESHFERVISAMIGMLRTYCETGQPFKAQWSNTLPRITLTPPPNAGEVNHL